MSNFCRWNSFFVEIFPFFGHKISFPWSCFSEMIFLVDFLIWYSVDLLRIDNGAPVLPNPDLIFHNKLPKCGSTTMHSMLQWELKIFELKNFESSIGKTSEKMLFNATIATGFMSVDDRCWRQFMLMTSLRYSWPISNFTVGHQGNKDTKIIVVSLTFNVTIFKSPTKRCHRHKIVINITVIITIWTISCIL